MRYTLNAATRASDGDQIRDQRARRRPVQLAEEAQQQHDQEDVGHSPSTHTSESVSSAPPSMESTIV